MTPQEAEARARSLYGSLTVATVQENWQEPEADIERIVAALLAVAAEEREAIACMAAEYITVPYDWVRLKRAIRARGK